MNKPVVCPVCGSEWSEYEVAFKCGAVMRSYQDSDIHFSWQCPHVFEKLQQARKDLNWLLNHTESLEDAERYQEILKRWL